MLLKRILIVVLSLAVLSGAIFFGVTFRFFDRPLSAKAQQDFRDTIALPDNFTLAASPVSTTAAKNSLQSTRLAVKSGAWALELNVAFNDKGVPYLADGPDYITSESVPLETVLRENAKRDTLRYILTLHNFGSAQKLFEMVRTYCSVDRVVLCGFTFQNILDVRSQYNNFKLCIDVDPSFGNLKDDDICAGLRQKACNAGAAYVRCSMENATQALSDALKVGTLGLILERVQNEYDMFFSLSLNPMVVITDHPGDLYEFLYTHDYLDNRMENPF